MSNDIKRLTIRVQREIYDAIQAAQAATCSPLNGAPSTEQYIRETLARDAAARVGRAELSVLTPEERNLVMDALNGINTSAEMHGLFAAAAYVYPEVADHIALNRADVHHGCDGPTVLRKLQALTLAGRIALVEEAIAFWRQPEEQMP